jgi:hypothetical protein
MRVLPLGSLAAPLESLSGLSRRKLAEPDWYRDRSSRSCLENTAPARTGSRSERRCDSPREMTERDPALEPFDALIGTWDMEAKHRLVDEVVLGSTTFEWLEGGHFLVQHSTMDHELFPDGISIIGAPEDGEGLVLESFDSRGVRRTYRTSLDDGVWRIWREQPGFDQRFSATLGPDHFEGIFQLAETPGEWQDDMTVSYRRRD